MPNEIDHGAAANAAYTEFGGLLAQEVGTDLGQAWGRALAAKSELEVMPDKLAADLEAIDSNPMLTATARVELRRQAGDVYESAVRAGVKKLAAEVSLTRSTLETAAISDLTTPLEDAGQRSLIRDEMDKYIATAMSPTITSGGTHRQPGATMQEALLNLARLDAARYGPEIAGSYGKSLLSATGQGSEQPKLVHLIQLSTPASTPRAQAARTALEAIKRTQLEGQTARIALATRAKIEAALNPKSDEPKRNWFDSVNNATKARR